MCNGRTYMQASSVSHSARVPRTVDHIIDSYFVTAVDVCTEFDIYIHTRATLSVDLSARTPCLGLIDPLDPFPRLYPCISPRLLLLDSACDRD